MSYGTVQAEKMTTESGYSLGAGDASSFKNRFLNGNMAIDQRNNGSAVTVTNAAVNFFGVDRFAANRANGYALSTSTVQQVTDAPAGFIKSVKYTNSTAETPTGAMYSNLAQYIEGNNVADLGWGTANAKSATLSFWVKISITGTFGVVLRSATATQSYAISFAYSTADTWQFVTATIPGPTTGTFYTDNNVGFSVNWDLGVGPTLSIAATGAWQTANGLGLASGTKVNSTAGATYQITGCQIEAGTVATSFDYRPYGTELQLCQRYCEVLSFDNDQYTGASGFALTSGTSYFGQNWTQVKRTLPTITFTGTNWNGQGLADTSSPSGISATRISLTGALFLLTASFSGTNGQVVNLRSLANSQKITISAEF